MCGFQPACSWIHAAALAALLGVGACDGGGESPLGAEGPGGPGAPGGAAGGAPGQAGALPTIVQPPEGFRSLDLGKSFLETNWGPDITAEQLPALKALTIDAALREDNCRTDVKQAEVALTQALITRTKPKLLAERTEAFVAAERRLVEEQISTIIALFGAFSAEQMQARLRMGYPPIFAELISAHAMTGAANPFARTDTALFTPSQIEDTLRRKLDVHAKYLVYQKSMATAVAEVSKLDLTQPDWSPSYKAAASLSLDAWVEYRTFAVGSFMNFVADLPSEPRNAFLLAEGLTDVLKPSDTRGASTGNLIPSNPNEQGMELGGGAAGAGSGMGGQGGGMGGQGGGMGGQGGGMGGQGGGTGGQGGGMGGQGGGTGGMGGSPPPGGGMGGSPPPGGG